MEVGTVSLALIITSLIVLTGQQNGFVNAATPKPSSTPVPSIAEQFHVVMIVMIVVIGFILIFSISCGLCVIFGIDIGCPIPCCGGGGKEKIPGSSASGMKLKRSSRPDRISSHKTPDVEEFQEVECKGFKGHGGAYGQDNMVYEF